MSLPQKNRCLGGGSDLKSCLQIQSGVMWHVSLGGMACGRSFFIPRENIYCESDVFFMYHVGVTQRQKINERLFQLVWGIELFGCGDSHARLVRKFISARRVNTPSKNVCMRPGAGPHCSGIAATPRSLSCHSVRSNRLDSHYLVIFERVSSTEEAGPFLTGADITYR